jgi:hypothetical protein
MRLPRFSVRRLMVAVAMVGVILATILGVERRRVAFQRLRWWYQGQASVYYSKKFDAERNTLESNRRSTDTVSELQLLEDYYWAMAGKYELAADRPWLPVAPDPPKPK